MPIASFGSKTFSVSQNKIYTFDEFNRTCSLNIEEQEVDGQKPSTYIKGSALDTVTLVVPLVKQKNLDVNAVINDWIMIKNKAQPQRLIIGNKVIGQNKFLLTNVTISDTVIDKNGNFIRAKLELEFKEFIRYGKKQKSTSKKSAGTKSSSKSSKKRTNINATSAKTNATLEKLEKELFGG